MTEEILVSPDRLHQLVLAGDCLVIDCRFDMTEVKKGRQDWLAGHIPGAHYAHLDDDLAAPITDQSGRHPLPETEVFAGFLASLGWSEGSLVVAYDEGSNAFAGRMWWLMHYFGQPAALLDGGLAAWKETALPLETGPVESQRAPLSCLQANTTMAVSCRHVLQNLETQEDIILDARSPERFAGQAESTDAKAGRIPGSVNRYMQLNLDVNGRFKDPMTLRREFEALLGERHVAIVVHSCGSGITACHNLFAMELAGMDPGKLYPGSWSEWIREPSRPTTTGS